MKLSKGRLAAIVAILLIASGCAVAWHPAISPAEQHATFPPDQIARGATLAAVGDCAVLGAEKASRALSGGDAENWYAPPLQAASPAAQPWTEDSLAS